MLKAWLQDNYGVVLDIAKTITRGKYPDYEELAHEVVVAILEADRARMNGIVKDGGMRHWVVRLCINNYRSKTSRYHYKYRKPDERHEKAMEHLQFVRDLDEIEDKKLLEEQLALVEKWAKEMPYFERNAFRAYYELNHSLNSLSEATGISRNTLYKAIRETRKHIIERHEERTRRHNSLDNESDRG